MQFRFIEAQDEQRTNHGKFALFKFGPKEWTQRSGINPGSLLGTLKPIHRLGGAFAESSVLFCDLQTREAFFVDLARGRDLVTRDFLCHPVHVCLLAYPLLMLLAGNSEAMWRLPNVVTIPVSLVCAQPGVLLDATGKQVRGQWEFSRRTPLVARLRNREVAGDDPTVGQDVLTAEESAASLGASKPSW